jgi:AAA+ superfamily predicted ATPase
MEQDFFTPVLKAGIDVVRFWITNAVDTGNKSQDNMIIVFILSIISVLSAGEFWKYLKLQYILRFSNYGENTDTIGEQHIIIGRLAKCVYYNRIQDEHEQKYYNNIYFKCNKTSFIVYLSYGKFVFMQNSFIYSSDKDTCDKVSKIIQNKAKVEIVNDDQKDKIYIKRYNTATTETRDYPLFKDRNFDNIVSKHKNRIINLIENFKAVNQGTKKCIGSYNLGFMFHGKPGCGKTMFIKCIANYLKRNIFVVDMRTIKTMEQLESIFTTKTVSENIFVFDEFDCVSDVISQRDSEYEEKDNETGGKLKGLKMTLTQLLSIQNKDDTVIKAIEDTKKNIKDLENGLNLDGILTLLDGVYEMRGRVIVASTNFINRIDKALLRPGRFDMVLELTEMEDWEVKDLVKMCLELSEIEKTLLDKIQVKNKVFTPAEIINICSASSSNENVFSQIKA